MMSSLLLALNIKCSGNNAGGSSWSDNFFGFTTEHAFHASRWWLGSDDELGKIGQHTYNGSRTKKSLIIKGEGIYAYVIVNSSSSIDIIKKEITDVVRRVIGPIAKPDKIQIVSGLPKTRSGKIMRRILRKVASNDFQNLGDTSTLLNPDIVEEIIKGAKQK